MKLLIFMLAATLGAQTKDYNINMRVLGTLDTTSAVATKPFRTVAVDQSGSCSTPNEAVLNSTNGKVFVCSVSTWVQISSSGTPSFDPQSANTVLAGPASGSSSVPGFRALVDADMPASYLANTRLINTASPLGGGGALTGNLTLTCSTCLVNDATYTNPAWLSTLAGSKLTGTVAAANGGLGANASAFSGMLAITSGAAYIATAADLPAHTHTASNSGGDLTGTFQGLDSDLTAIAAISGVQGDLILRGASAWSRLAIGASGRYLRSDGTTAAWSPISAADLPAALSSSTSINGLTLTASTGTFTLASGKTLTVSNTLTLAGTDSSSIAFGAGGTVAYTTSTYSDPAWITSLSASKLTGTVSNAQGGFGTSIGSLTGVLKVAAGTPSVVTGTSTDCVKVDGTSGACGSSSIPDEGLRVSAASGAARLSTGSRRIGSTVYTLSALCDVTPTAGTGNILYWMTNTGTFSAGHNMTATVTSGTCTIAGSTTSFPPGSMPLGYCAVSAGPTLGACVNVAQSGRDSISGSAGVTVTGDAPQAISANVAELGVIVAVDGTSATPACAIPAGALVATCSVASFSQASMSSSTLTGTSNGQRITWKICRDSTATRTWVWPSNVLGFLDPIQIASGCTVQSGTVHSSNLVADSSANFIDAGATGVSNFSLCKAGSTIPTAAIPSGYIALGCDTAAFHAITSAGVDTTLGAGGGGYAGTVTCGAGTTTTSTTPTALATITYGSGLSAGDMLRITSYWKHTGGTTNSPRFTVTLGGTNIDSLGNVQWASASDGSASYNAVIHVIDTGHQRVQGGYFRSASWQGGANWGVANENLTVTVSGSVNLVFNGYFASGSGETLSLDHYCVERVKQ